MRWPYILTAPPDMSVTSLDMEPASAKLETLSGTLIEESRCPVARLVTEAVPVQALRP